MATGRPGYDSPARTREEDDLDRWRFASDIVETITTTPSDWSVRVGVFGKWGEGKSSVLHFIERMLEDDGHLVFWFNPWAATDWNHLWDEFAQAFVEALDRAGVKPTGFARVKSKLRFRRAQPAVERRCPVP